MYVWGQTDAHAVSSQGNKKSLMKYTVVSSLEIRNITDSVNKSHSKCG